MESAVIAEAVEVKLERLGLDQEVSGHVIDHQMREIGLAGDRAETGELRRGEARHVVGIGMRVGYAVKHRLLGRGGQRGRASELQPLSGHGAYVLCYWMPRFCGA